MRHRNTTSTGSTRHPNKMPTPNVSTEQRSANLNKRLTFHSKAPTAIPAAAPVPAKPIKCELPMFDEKSEKATGRNQSERPASRKSVALPVFDLEKKEMPKPVPRTIAK